MPPIHLPLGPGAQSPESGAQPPENFQGFMLILDPESTCNWHCNKNSNSHSGTRVQNEQ